jgi:hypothetical protein
LSAAWLAAGSLGLLGHALRHGVTLVFLGASLVLGWPGGWAWRRTTGAGAVILGALLLQSSDAMPVNVCASALVLCGLAWTRNGADAEPFVLAAQAVLGFALYRFALESFPWFWLALDALAQGLTRLIGWLVRQPLLTGATYAGFDFLLLSALLMGLWFRRTTKQGLTGWMRHGAVLLLVHVAYLAVLAYSVKLLGVLPSEAPKAEFGARAPWSFGYAVRELIPWNLPAVAWLFHLGALWRFCRRAFSLTDKSMPARAERTAPARDRTRLPFLRRAGCPLALLGLALTLPPLVSLYPGPLSLAGKKIVVHEKGFLNWMKPKHGEYGRLSVGMYGMLPEFLRSYGAQCLISPELSASELDGASLLVLIFPNKPWAPGQLERIWEFVRRGGSLLVLGEHTVREKEGGNRFNDVLQPTALRVAFDSSMFEIGGWLESYHALANPATIGVRAHRNEFGVVIGASVEARWPARPLLVGLYGFSDPGDPTNDESKGGSMMGNHHYDAGEKLGDQLLAAEQRFGRGRVLVFGDTSGFSNGILFGAHDFVARLYASLCDEPGALWFRGLLSGAAALLLGGLLSLRRAAVPWLLGLVAVMFSISSWTAASWSHHAATVLPDGRSRTPNRLAYIDTSHLERSSGESWRDEGLGGLQLTLMRNGYLVLGLPEFSAARLERAGLLISSAPARAFTSSETRALRRFIEEGGTFICTVGWPEAAASRPLLAELGFWVGGIGAATTGAPEPKPFGHFKAPFFNGGEYMAYVRFHAAWNVESSDPQARPLAFGPRDPKGPADQPDPAVILMRRLGRGKAVVVADTDFATNMNLEREGGQPFEGMRENADFWRWLLSYLADEPVWPPPKPAPAPAATAEPAAPEPANPTPKP